ncbi:DUF393 domain-containing protein [bacterium]|nr:DUF393 domain-containing protein [bacterium]
MSSPDADRPTDRQSDLDPTKPIIFYDGVCGFCNRLVKLIIKHDRHDQFRFASLQSDFARDSLLPLGRNPDDLDSLYMIEHPGTDHPVVYSKSDVSIRVWPKLGGLWKLAAVLKIVPRPIRDLGYDFISSIRYRIWGKYDQCLLPTPEQRERFIEV